MSDQGFGEAKDYVEEVKQKLELTEAIKKSFRRIADLPEWMQAILLEDIRDAIENRVRTMEMILKGATAR